VKKIVYVKLESTNQMTAARLGGERTRVSVDYLCVFQLSFYGSWFVRTGRGSIVVEFFSQYFLYNLSDRSTMLGRWRR
jgi:hypothetical protein